MGLGGRILSQLRDNHNYNVPSYGLYGKIRHFYNTSGNIIRKQ